MLQRPSNKLDPSPSDHDCIGMYLCPLDSPLSHVLPLRLGILGLPGPFCGAVPALLSVLPLGPWTTWDQTQVFCVCTTAHLHELVSPRYGTKELLQVRVFV